MMMIRIAEDIVIEDREIDERFVRAFGARGQNVKKEATAVQLSFNIRRSSLPRDVKERLVALAGRSVKTSGVLVVVSRANRSQAQNREAARTRLVALLQRAAKPPKRRKPTRLDASVRETRLASKHLRSAVKALRVKGRRGQDL